ncbi:MAG: aldo/keto reductase [Rhodospirillaceae bacterium]|nr:aldo/keto reductase [Rhodospirillaceae bacterium]
MAVPQRRLGRSGLIVSRLCLGTMQFGVRTEEADARRIVDHAAAQGVNFIDTADTYVDGVSEQIVGRAIAAKRDYWVLATKLAVPIPGAGPNRKGLSRKWIMEETDVSLKRLGTDFIDILYLHREDIGTPLEETVRALGDLQRAGKIRYFGLSNFKAWRVAKVCAICDSEGIGRPVVNQPVYHALNRMIEVELLPACADLGLGVFPYSPNARGILSGKYANGATPEGSRASLGAGNQLYSRMVQSEFRPENLAVAEAIAAHARKRGIDPTAFAVAWVLANPLVTGTIAGPRTLAQWESYLTAFDVTWTAEDDAAIDALVPAGTTAVPQFVDPAYPVEGRPA